MKLQEAIEILEENEISIQLTGDCADKEYISQAFNMVLTYIRGFDGNDNLYSCPFCGINPRWTDRDGGLVLHPPHSWCSLSDRAFRLDRWNTRLKPSELTVWICDEHQTQNCKECQE